MVRTGSVRKRISGVCQEDRLGPESYTAKSQGAAVILDAVFALPAQRAAAVDLAREFLVPFDGLWIDAQEEMGVSRVISRKRNISDVMEIIAREQSDYDLGEIAWARIANSGPKRRPWRRAVELLALDRVFGF